MSAPAPSTVMAVLVPAIHVFFGAAGVRVDARAKPAKPGHDGAGRAADSATGEMATTWEVKR